MESVTSPPSPPEITDSDRATLHEKITALCRKKEISQNNLEKELNLSNGFLSKLWAGKVHFKVDLLLGICKYFACEPLDVVGGTGFEYLLDVAPPDAESEAVRRLRDERDTALARAAAAESEVRPLREAISAAMSAREAAEARAASAESRCADLEAEVRAITAARDVQMAEAKSAREAAAIARSEVTKAGGRVVAAQFEERRLKSAMEELNRRMEEWKNWATARDARANFLEQQLRALEAEYQRVVQNANVARQRSQQLQVQLANGQQGAAVGGSLFGLAAGLLIAAAASDTTPKRRRRK